VLAFLGLACPDLARAHPPYERPERVITDKDGRSSRLVRSYVDGIFFSDPVKLVVRDADDRTVAETEYGHNIAVLCPRSRPCLVFRYDSSFSVLPTHIWRLEGGRLHETRSRGLVALGVVAPLWDNMVGYASSLVSLSVPLLLFWLLFQSPESRRRTLLLAVAGLASLAYLGGWLYTVALLSYQSLPLVLAASAAGAGTMFLARKAALRLGATEPTLLKLARGAAILISAAAAIVVVGLIVLVVWLAVRSSGIPNPR